MNFNNLKKLIQKVTSVILFVILTLSLSSNSFENTSNQHPSNTILVHSAEACGNGQIGGAQASACSKENSQRFGYDQGIINFCGKISGFNDISKVAYCVASALAYVVLTFAVVRFVWGAFVLLTDTKNGKERAKSIIFNALIAMVIAVVALQGAPIITGVLTGDN